MAAEQLWSTFHSPLLIRICNESNDERTVQIIDEDIASQAWIVLGEQSQLNPY